MHLVSHSTGQLQYHQVHYPSLLRSSTRGSKLTCATDPAGHDIGDAFIYKSKMPKVTVMNHAILRYNFLITQKLKAIECFLKIFHETK